MVYELAFLQALVLTIIIKCIVAALIKKFLGWRFRFNISYKYLIAVVSLASTFTLPYAWFILPAFLEQGMIYILISELFVVIAELLFYKLILKVSYKSAFALAFTTNAFSFFIGNILF